MQRPIKRSRLLFVAATLLILSTLFGSIFVFGQARAQADTPVGQWSVAIARTDVPVDIAASYSYVGRWRLGIDADGTYQAERLDVNATVVSGSWETDGDQITFTDEDGLLSCNNLAAAPIIEDDLDSGTYTWTRTDKTLTLTRVDDACPGRIILLTTYAFSIYVACSTPPIPMSELLGTPAAEPEEPETAASPVAIGPILNLDASPTPMASPVAAPDASPGASPAPMRLDFTAEIDAVLAQMTACWASKEPERWLALLSTEFREALIESDPNFLETLTISMTSPIVWERGGEITIDSPRQITVVVKSTVGTETDFQNFIFVFEDGQWKWNG